MDLEQIQSMWENDSKVDDVMLDQASLKIPQLHQKYLSLHSNFSLLLKKARQQHKKLSHNKWLYYSGKAAPEEYEDKPFNYKVMNLAVRGEPLPGVVRRQTLVEPERLGLEQSPCCVLAHSVLLAPQSYRGDASAGCGWLRWR